jgi:hypothetical protein
MALFTDWYGTVMIGVSYLNLRITAHLYIGSHGLMGSGQPYNHGLS